MNSNAKFVSPVARSLCISAPLLPRSLLFRFRGRSGLGYIEACIFPLNRTI